MSRYKTLFLALSIGMLSGAICTIILINTENGGGDFGWALRTARDVLQGRDPYAYPIAPDLVSYPLPAGLFAIPFSWLADEYAAGLFFGLSSALLAWCLLQDGQDWQLLIFFSWTYLYNLLFAQWTPLLLCIWFLPVLSFLVLIKPHIALPLVLTTPIRWPAIIIGVVVLAVSLLIYPTWPWVWLQQIRTYKGTQPPLFSLPLGPLVLLALLHWRERRARLLLLMALMPQRVVYDQLVLMLVASNRKELIFLIICSWVSLPVLYLSGGWTKIPGGWQLWIMLTLYIPALIVLLQPELKALRARLVVRREGE